MNTMINQNFGGICSAFVQKTVGVRGFSKILKGDYMIGMIGMVS